MLNVTTVSSCNLFQTNVPMLFYQHTTIVPTDSGIKNTVFSFLFYLTLDL
jgi:hypothetical protein